ncbi:hypothetical protein [Streptomyces sp. NPDC060194]|uniref:hypothetical protein n=1 Tax=Streptomyces sp. NPDC060194 TaxID=3347069 RepID=UPI003655427C
MEAVIAVVALLFVLFLAAGVYATVKAVGAAKRGVDRTVSQARRTYEDTALRAKTYTQGGAAGALAELRLSLRTSMRSTQDALAASPVEDGSLTESKELFARLSEHGHALDGELRLLERDPDRARISERLPDLKERTERIVHAADSMRWAVRDRARKFADDDLASLSAQIEVESGALRHWATEGGAASPADELAELDRQPWPEPAGREGSAAAGGEAGAQGATLADPQAITAGGRPGPYPWEERREPVAERVADPRARTEDWAERKRRRPSGDV